MEKEKHKVKFEDDQELQDLQDELFSDQDSLLSFEDDKIISTKSILKNKSVKPQILLEENKISKILIPNSTCKSFQCNNSKS